jgi:hypothetical protein
MPAERPEEATAFVDRVFADQPQEFRDELAAVYKDAPDAMAKQTRGTQPIERTTALARSITLDPDDVVPPGTAANAEQLAASTNLVSSIHARIRTLRAQLAENPTSTALATGLREEHARFVRAAQALGGFRSEAGRSLRILQEQLGEITPAARGARFTVAASKYGASADDITAALERAGDDPLRQYNELLNIARADWKTKAHSYYVLNLLTNPKTLERNAFGNAIRVMEDPLVRPIAGGLDAIRSAVTGGDRRVYADEGWQMVLGAKKSLPDAWSAFLQVMRQGFTDDQAMRSATAGKFDVRPEPFGGGVAHPFNAITRFLDGTDQFFRLLNTGMQRDALALYRAKQAGGTLEEIAANAADYSAALARGGGHAIDREAVDYEAARSVFRETNKFASDTQRWIDARGPITKGVFRFILPFLKTPANIIRQGFEHTPAGFVFKGAGGGDRTAALRQAEAAFGTTVMGGAVWLALNGHLSGDAPTDPGDKDYFYAQHPPNSFQVPGYGWVPYNELGPLGTGLGIVANTVQTWQAYKADPTDSDAWDLTKRVGAALLGVGSGIFDRSFLSGLADAMDAARDPRARDHFIQNRVTSLVPGAGFGRAITQATEESVPDVRGYADSIKSITPGLASDVRPRLDAFGQPAKRAVTGAASWFTLAPGHGRPDPVRDELARVGIKPDPFKTTGTLKLGNVGIRLTSEQDFALREAKGRARHAFLARAMASPVYQNADDTIRERILKKQLSRGQAGITERAKHLARRDVPFTVETLLQGIAP